MGEGGIYIHVIRSVFIEHLLCASVPEAGSS